jgi:hypothetical protein
VKLYTGLRTRGARLLCKGTVFQCYSVRMYLDESVIVIDGQKQDYETANRFAVADGFKCLSDMMRWFREQYNSDEFEGFCVRW